MLDPALRWYYLWYCNCMSLSCFSHKATARDNRNGNMRKNWTVGLGYSFREGRRTSGERHVTSLHQSGIDSFLFRARKTARKYDLRMASIRDSSSQVMIRRRYCTGRLCEFYEDYPKLSCLVTKLCTDSLNLITQTPKAIHNSNSSLKFGTDSLNHIAQFPRLAKMILLVWCTMKL